MFRRAWIWCTAPLVDGQEGLSLTRFLAIYFALLAGHLVEHTHTLPLNVLWLALASIATAFGKSTFTFLVRRMEFKGASTQAQTDTHQVIDQTTRVIEERRNAAGGYEPT